MTDTTAAQAAPAKPTFAERVKLGFERLRNSAGIFRSEAVTDLEAMMNELDERVAAVEAKVAPAAAAAEKPAS